MLRPGGILTCDDGRACDTFTCGHCCTVVFVKPRCDPADAGGRCKLCDRLICGGCADLRRCTPWERELERQEARSAALRSYGM